MVWEFEVGMINERSSVLFEFRQASGFESSQDLGAGGFWLRNGIGLSSTCLIDWR